ncbi:hypothetical protein N5T82_01900 [Aliarcobacter cryaerophilus]|uniref:hypothetical protein n=1 Tax=Aliarcobacter cryaerophilus TaxID=28198 RepID=UPI0021B5075E|nr:hypothetical protein [Aliarcobacter cryaerophilus]MCT7538595.1 hypothetical protein [Aliarcobacter cryaerophilus]MCT7542433.1 hypothetical protein [Aliarcobacter cryaerophilus]
MKKIILGYFLAMCLFSNIGFTKSLDEAKIGLKGVYLEQDSNEACKIIKDKFSNEKYEFSKKDSPYGSDICKTKSIMIFIDDEKKVKSISYRPSAFGIEEMSLKEFSQLILDNVSWLPRLDYYDGKYEKYYYIDNIKLGFSIEINTFFGVRLSKEKVIVNKPNFD